MRKVPTRCRPIRIRSCVFVVWSLSFCCHSLADTLDVPGTYGTIQDALDAATDGDVVLVAPGVYTQNLSFGTKQVALRSTAGPASTIISVAGGVGVELSGHAELTGFTITGAASNFGAAVRVHGIGTVIKGNVFDDNTAMPGGFGAAIGANSASPIVDGNVFKHNHADNQYNSGVVCFINSSSPTIINNVFEDNFARTLNLLLPRGNSPVVANNTFVGNPIAVKYASYSPTTFTNNIFDGNTTAVTLDYPYYLPTWTSNLVHNNGTDYAGGLPDYTGTDGNISADPLFVSASDFHLQLGSPAINAGQSLDAPDHDFDGTPRPFGGAYDIGAFERVPEPTSIVLAGLGSLLLGYHWRRRTKKENSHAATP